MVAPKSNPPSNVIELPVRRRPTSTPPPDKPEELPPIEGTGVYDPEEIARIKLLGARGLPRCPSADIVPSAVIPSPTKLDPKLSDAELVRQISFTYRECIRKRFHVVSRFMLGRGLTTDHPYYAKMVAAARKMIELDIAPAAWILFSFDVWGQHRRGPATAAFTFSTKRMASRIEWFEDVRWQTYAHSRRVHAPSLRALYDDWQRMWRQILAESPKDQLHLMTIVDRYFPGRSYEDRVIQAKAESRRMQMQIDKEIDAGGCLWL